MVWRCIDGYNKHYYTGIAIDSDPVVCFCSLLKSGTVVLGLCPRIWLKLIAQRLLTIFR
jgi:hypothetical protein